MILTVSASTVEIFKQQFVKMSIFTEPEGFELCYIWYVMNCAIWYVMEISKTFHLIYSCFPTVQKSVNLASAIH